jgi:hypothetical protein
LGALAAGHVADRPLSTGLDYGWRAFTNRSESETQPRITSALNSEAS